MKIFSGFPSGRVEVTPLPNQFFSELCPSIDDLAELKLTLHVLWLFAHRMGEEARQLRASELRADPTLMQSLTAAGGKPDESLSRALAAATERGTLLVRAVEGDVLYFLNNDSGRRAYAQSERTVPGRPRGVPREPAPAGDRPNIFVLYEQNVGLLTPMISEELKAAEEEYPAEWIADAFKEAVEHNARNWKYIRAILERWKTEGRSGEAKRKKTWYGDEYAKFVKR
jgi:DnaD/phage-associated family protein